MWRPSVLGELVAERQLVLQRPGEPPDTVVVRFGRPVRAPVPEDPETWWCPVQVIGLGTNRITSLPGVDSLQALVLALEFVTNTLPDAATEAGGTINWLGETEQPVFASTRQIEQFSRAHIELLRGLETALAFIENCEGNAGPDRDRLLLVLRSLVGCQGFFPKPRSDESAV
jgi:hypothetical protein